MDHSTFRGERNSTAARSGNGSGGGGGGNKSRVNEGGAEGRGGALTVLRRKVRETKKKYEGILTR